MRDSGGTPGLELCAGANGDTKHTNRVLNLDCAGAQIEIKKLKDRRQVFIVGK